MGRIGFFFNLETHRESTVWYKEVGMGRKTEMMQGTVTRESKLTPTCTNASKAS